MAVSLKLSLADAECIGPTLPGGKSLDLIRSFPARGLGVALAGVEDHPPEPPGLGAVATLLGQDGEVAQGEVAVDALVDAAELVGTLQGQDPPPAGFGLGGLAGFAMEYGLAEMDLGVVGVEPQALGTCAKPRESLRASGGSGRSGRRACAGESVGAEPAQAVLEIIQGGRPVLTLDGDRAQVEEDERIVGPLGELGVEDLAMALRACVPAAPGRCSRCAGR